MTSIKDFLLGSALFFSVTLLGTAHAQPNPSMEIYVAPNGDDYSRGQFDAPFATVQAALNYSRAIRSGIGGGAPISIILREGTYRMTGSIHLDGRDHLLTIRAYDGENVVFSGGRSIPIDAIEQRNGIYEVNLKELGIQEYGRIRKVGFGRPYGASWGELFVNQRAFHLARYPNSGMLPIEEVLDAGSLPRLGDYSDRGGAFRYRESRIDKWVDEPDPWIGGYFMWGYADDMIPVAKVDSAEKTIRTGAATMYGFADKAPYRTWYGVNLKAELDTIFEYYVDRESGMLYFMSDEPPARVEFSMLEIPFFQIEDTKWLTIKGITFENARGIGITSTNTQHMVIEGCVFQHLGSLGLTMGLGIEPFENFQEKDGDIAAKGIVGSLPQYMYKNTTFDRKSGNSNILRHCVFKHLGAGGVSLGGGDRLTLEKGNNRVENCVFFDNNRIEKSYRAAIYLSGVGNVISHCEIFDTPGVAILMNGNDHLIEYNDIHDVATEVNDLGAIYYGRDPSERGIVVRYNLITDIPAKFLTAAIYHDDGACGLTAYSNILINAGQRSVLMGGGSDNKYYNNLFIGSEAGIFIDDRLRTWAKHLTVPDSGLSAQRLRAVNFTGDVYRLAYPTLVDYFANVPQPTNNLVDRNVFINFKEPVYAKGKTMGWRKTALGFTRNNVIKKDDDMMSIIHASGIKGVLADLGDALDPIPVDQIGVIESRYIKTTPSRLGVQRFDAANSISKFGADGR